MDIRTTIRIDAILIALIFLIQFSCVRAAQEPRSVLSRKTFMQRVRTESAATKYRAPLDSSLGASSVNTTRRPGAGIVLAPLAALPTIHPAITKRAKGNLRVYVNSSDERPAVAPLAP